MEDCILWKGAVNSSGYGVTWFNGKTAYAHRVVVKASPGDVVRHICDNPKCVNPNHLVIGTNKENSQDMVSKKRQAYGERAGNSKLKKEEVIEIRKYKGNLSSRKVANIFGISKTNVLDIWKRKIWKEI